MKIKNKKVVVIGGGTGTFVALTGLKKYPLSLSAVITMMDSGGSSGRLRDNLGVLPPGDLRQALVALSESDKLWRDLFLYRFVDGDLKGHNFGNIFLSVLEKTTGSLKQAVEVASMILDTCGDVIPITYTDSQLCVELVDGTIIEGETHIDEPKEKKERARIKRAFLKPPARANPKALQAIQNADAVVIGPGDLYTSIIPNLLVGKVSETLQRSKAKKLFVMNLMTKYGQTTNYTARDHLQDLIAYSGPIDTVVVNDKKPDAKTLRAYKRACEIMVENDLTKSDVYVVETSLLENSHVKKVSGDAVRRSLIRHNFEKLALTLVSLL